MTPPALLSIAQVAARCGVHRNTVEGWVHQGRFGPYIAHRDESGRVQRILVHEAQVRAYLDRVTVVPAKVEEKALRIEEILARPKRSRAGR